MCAFTLLLLPLALAIFLPRGPASSSVLKRAYDGVPYKIDTKREDDYVLKKNIALKDAEVMVETAVREWREERKYQDAAELYLGIPKGTTSMRMHIASVFHATVSGITY